MRESLFSKKNLQSFFAEFFMSFIFGYTVYSAILNTKNQDYAASDVTISLAITLVSVSIIYTFLDHTICHFNPAITLAAILTFKLPLVSGLIYMLMQVAGFLAAISMTFATFPQPVDEILEILTPNRIDPSTSSVNIFFTEHILTGILTFVAFANAINAKRDYNNSFYEEQQKDRSIIAPLTIGITLGFLSILGSTTSGGVFNPGITFASQVTSNTWNYTWEYYIGQFTGGLAGGLIQVWLLFK